MNTRPYQSIHRIRLTFTLALGAAVAVGLISCGRQTSQTAPTETVRTAQPRQSPPGSAAPADTILSVQMLLGNPDGATDRPSNRTHYLIQRPLYALSYNDSWRFPNWVSWRLRADDIGATSRGEFRPDNSLPAGFYQVTPGDYTRSGYDRGHNCPSADRSASREDNDSVFLMSNITPQAHGLNAGPWEKLESYCRDLAHQGNTLYIVCGHGFSAPTHETIGAAQIAVPDFGWKIAVVVPDQPGDDDLSRISADSRVIAVKMPNINTVSNEPWTRYIVTPAEIEKATGLHFFTSLSGSVVAALDAKRDSAGGEVAASSSGAGDRGAAPREGALRMHRRINSPPAPPGIAGEVWVNTRSGAYWRPGTEYYGKTMEGRYMSEQEARSAGYHPAGGQ